MRTLVLIFVSLCLISCKAAPPHAPKPPPSHAGAPKEYLDPVTAAMVSSVTAPLIFARAHQDVAANERQYANLIAVSVNRSGHYEYLLLAYIWSTVDARLGKGAHPGETLVILADDRAIRIQRDGRTLQEAGLAQPIDRPLYHHGQPRIYKTDRETLQFISTARHVRLQLEGDQDGRPFELWKDGRRALGQLAATN
jgi:hypothetical protein